MRATLRWLLHSPYDVVHGLFELRWVFMGEFKNYSTQYFFDLILLYGMLFFYDMYIRVFMAVDRLLGLLDSG